MRICARMSRLWIITFGFCSTLMNLDAAAPLVAVLPDKMPPVKAIPFQLGPHVNPQGLNISVDSQSLWLDEARWIPTSGEIHHARVPAAQWRQELLKMKAGGLDTIGAYAFWIHYEELEGQWNFTGRRNLRKFIQTAQDVGMKVIMRVGPWDHGEARNGGHPDWLLQRAKDKGFELRSNNSHYMGYVAQLYARLAAQLDGLWWDQGGPIFAMQVDNETPNWQYLLALQDLATKVGLRPSVYTKTGWPTPSAGYPKNYPMLPFFGGYADVFWTNDMHEDPSKQDYFFGQGPSLQSTSGWTVPEGYPWLDIEIGGGMAVAYNHRPYMQPEDMPAAHLTFLANGVNGLGYYMYHGGNNPHSIFGDSPEAGLQESSFQPAGAANPMPSLSYDFFAPLGEFGQPRRHYHQMRRLHLFVRDFGTRLASMKLTMPQIVPKNFDDNTTLRWAVRSTGTSGFVFLNNYERLNRLPAKTDIRLELHFSSGKKLSIPHPISSALSFPSGIWAHWPFNLAVGSVTITYATAQVLSLIATGSVEMTIVLVETEGVPVEVAFPEATNLIYSSGTAIFDNDGGVVLRSVVPSTSATIIAEAADGRTLKIIVLPCSLADHVWKGMLAGKETLVVSDVVLVLHDGDKLRVSANSTSASFALLPTPAQLTISGKEIAGVADGAFVRYTVPVELQRLPSVVTKKLREAAAARDVPKSPCGKAQEPTAEDWKQAAIWELSLNGTAGITDASQVRLAIRYRGDAARLYAGETLLTDNWFTGYQGDGQMEVGLSYLANEVPRLLGAAANLTLHVLPLRKDSLEAQVFIRAEFWPDFEGKSSVCALDGVDVLQLGTTTLSADQQLSVLI